MIDFRKAVYDPSLTRHDFRFKKPSDAQMMFVFDDAAQEIIRHNFMFAPMRQDTPNDLLSQLRVVNNDIKYQTGFDFMSHIAVTCDMEPRENRLNLVYSHLDERGNAMLQLFRASKTKIYEEVSKASKLIDETVALMNELKKERDELSAEVEKQKKFVEKQSRAISDALKLLDERFGKMPQIPVFRALAGKWRHEGEFYDGADEMRARQECADDLLKVLGLQEYDHTADYEILDQYKLADHVVGMCDRKFENARLEMHEKHVKEMENEITCANGVFGGHYPLPFTDVGPPIIKRKRKRCASCGMRRIVYPEKCGDDFCAECVEESARELEKK